MLSKCNPTIQDNSLQKTVSLNKSTKQSSFTFHPQSSNETQSMLDICSFLVDEFIDHHQENLSSDQKKKHNNTSSNQPIQQQDSEESQESQKKGIVTMQTDVLLLIKKKTAQSKLVLQLDQVTVGSQMIPYKSINQISLNKAKTFDFNILSISRKNLKPLHLSVDCQRKDKYFPPSFLIFSKLLERILKKTMKYYEIQWQKSGHLQKNVMVGAYIFGKIYKKAQHKNSWEQRYVVINKERLQSYRSSLKLEKPSFIINKKQVRSIFTSFQTLEDLLIVGIRYSGSLREKQTLFAFSAGLIHQDNGKNWLFQFWRLMTH